VRELVEAVNRSAGRGS